jgi:DNA mismatch repair ATPase MutS
MHPEAAFDAYAELPPMADALLTDLELQTLLDAMAGGDPMIEQVARTALLNGVADPALIAYRQAALRDCLAQPDAIRQLYGIASAALHDEHKQWGLSSYTSAHSILSRSLTVIELLVRRLRQLREVGERAGVAFYSEAFTDLFATLARKCSDEYFNQVAEVTALLQDKRGTLAAVRLDAGNRGQDYLLLQALPQSWRDRVTALRRHHPSFQISDRDEAGARAVAELADRSLDPAANATAQAAQHVLSFMRSLQTELAFYVGCLNLQERLTELGLSTYLPRPRERTHHTLAATDLYDVCLALHSRGSVVANDIKAPGGALVLMTGTNRGGKSTLLRAIGLAQLMMQCGMFVGAASFTANVRSGIFTHFKRPEDPSMHVGKLAEELERMHNIVKLITPDSMLLCNESFASTNEREGSEISRQLVTALIDSGVKVLFVTHLYELAHGFYDEQRPDTVFLRATPPDANGEPTFKLAPGEPEPTSHGLLAYERVFGAVA